MKIKFKWMLLLIISGMVALTSFLGCSSKYESVTLPQGMTSVETVQFYFEQWNNKNIEGMDSVVCDEMKGADFGMSELVYARLNKSNEETEKHMSLEGAYFNDTFPGYIKYSIIEVEFEIEYKKSSGGFPSGKSNINNWIYVLGKTSEGSDWIIISWGV